jgi:hypothetical protein
LETSSVFNADLLCKLTEANKGGAFNKLVVLQVGSILEAALGQIISRGKALRLTEVV